MSDHGIGFFMPIQQDLLDLDELFHFFNLSIFTQHIPVEWIESALRLSSKATIRCRRLPSEQVLWSVLSMALFHDEPDQAGSGPGGSGVQSLSLRHAVQVSMPVHCCATDHYGERYSGIWGG